MDLDLTDPVFCFIGTGLPERNRHRFRGSECFASKIRVKVILGAGFDVRESPLYRRDWIITELSIQPVECSIVGKIVFRPCAHCKIPINRNR